MLDPTFIRPIAHRGLHDMSRGIIENAPSAFSAAIGAGYGIECDLQSAAGGEPVVFHDETLERLTDANGRVADQTSQQLARLAYRGSADRVMSFAELLELVGGRVPLLVEIKSDWSPTPDGFLERIADLSRDYGGPLALMSFDPVVMSAVRELSPVLPRGIISGVYKGEGWWSDVLNADRRRALGDLLESAPAQPHFYAYDVDDLPTSVTRFVREVLGKPLFAWTVRTPDQWARAQRWADAPIFEGEVPAGSWDPSNQRPGRGG